jgi:hypothetical protein
MKNYPFLQRRCWKGTDFKNRRKKDRKKNYIKEKGKRVGKGKSWSEIGLNK